MATIDRKNFSTPRNLNIKEGIVLFGTGYSTSPIGSGRNGLYVDSSNNLIFSTQGTTKTLLGGTVTADLIIVQSTAGSTTPCITMSQGGTAAGFMSLTGTVSATDASISTGDKTSGGTVKYIKININDTTHWIQCYENS